MKLSLLATRISLPLWYGLLLLFALPTFGREQITLQKTTSGTQLSAADTFLDQANPTNPNGSAVSLRVQSRSTQNQRTLVQFDLSSVPNAGIKSATLTLHVATPPSSTRTYNAHRVTSFFTENNASWNNRAPATTPWGAAGGDFNATATNSFTITSGSTSAVWDITAGPAPVGARAQRRISIRSLRTTMGSLTRATHGA